MLHELPGQVQVDQLQGHRLHTPGLALSQGVSQGTKPAVGDKIWVLGAQQHGIKDPGFLGKKHQHQHKNHHDRAPQVGPQGIKMLHETHGAVFGFKLIGICQAAK